MKYLIHSYPKRMWYVEKYLVPSMIEQGISKDDIIIYNDTNKLGNLRAFLDSAKLVMDNEGATWHLQDDIVISSDFKEKTEKYQNSIVCGFCNNYSEADEGYVPIQDMWYSFLCIRINNALLKEFVEWMKLPIVNKTYEAYISQGKFDDSLFRLFMMARHPNNMALNLKPNIVDNVDYLLGGSIANSARDKSLNINSLYFNEVEQIEMLKKEFAGMQ